MEAAIHQLVNELFEQTKRLPADKLRSLPATEELKVPLDGVQVTRFHDSLERERHLVAVQALKPRLGGMVTNIEVLGFVLAANGSIEEAPEELLWQFK